MPDLLLVGIRFALFADLMLVVGLAGFLLTAHFGRAERWLCVFAFACLNREAW